MKNRPDFPLVTSGDGVYLNLEDGKRLIDGISSWWSVIHGYNHPELNQAIINQVNSISHVMLGGLTNRPAKALAEKLAAITPEGLNHVFFSDSGSTGVEIAIKMAVQYWGNKDRPEKNKILSLKNGYHGDTCKAMEVSDDSDFNRTFSGILNRGFFLNTPAGGFFAGEKDIARDIESLRNILEKHHQEIAAFLLEPLVQCAGGFKMYSPLYLKAARELCNTYDVLFIFDEIATGFGRTGKRFAAEYTGISPDIMIVGKALTGGYLGHAATIASTAVFNAFLNDDMEKAFMHGPTFMGNPLSCAVALRSIEVYERENYPEKISQIEGIIKEEFSAIASSDIIGKRVLGAIGAIEVNENLRLTGFTQFAVDHGVWLRPIGNVIYLMPPYIIKEKELRQLLGVIGAWFKK